MCLMRRICVFEYNLNFDILKMGTQQSKNSVLMRNWQRKDKAILMNVITGELITQTNLTFQGCQEQNQALRFLQNRINDNHSDVLKLIYFTKVLDTQTHCIQITSPAVRVYTETAGQTLADFQQPTQSCFCEAIFRGCNYLARKYGYFHLDQHCIWVSNSDTRRSSKAKIWINSNPAETRITTVKQEVMVECIKSIIRSCRDRKICQNFTTEHAYYQLERCRTMEDIASFIHQLHRNQHHQSNPQKHQNQTLQQHIVQHPTNKRHLNSTQHGIYPKDIVNVGKQRSFSDSIVRDPYVSPPAYQYQTQKPGQYVPQQCHSMNPSSLKNFFNVNESEHKENMNKLYQQKYHSRASNSNWTENNSFEKDGSNGYNNSFEKLKEVPIVGRKPSSPVLFTHHKPIVTHLNLFPKNHNHNQSNYSNGSPHSFSRLSNGVSHHGFQPIKNLNNVTISPFPVTRSKYNNIKFLQKKHTLNQQKAFTRNQPRATCPISPNTQFRSSRAQKEKDRSNGLQKEKYEPNRGEQKQKKEEQKEEHSLNAIFEAVHPKIEISSNTEESLYTVQSKSRSYAPSGSQAFTNSGPITSIPLQNIHSQKFSQNEQYEAQEIQRVKKVNKEHKKNKQFKNPIQKVIYNEEKELLKAKNRLTLQLEQLEDKTQYQKIFIKSPELSLLNQKNFKETQSLEQEQSKRSSPKQADFPPQIAKNTLSPFMKMKDKKSLEKLQLEKDLQQQKEYIERELEMMHLMGHLAEEECIQEKVRKKKASFAHLKAEAFKLLEDV